MILLLLLGIVGLSNYLTAKSSFDKIYKSYDLIELSSQRIQEAQRILYKTYEYRLVNLGLSDPPSNLKLDRQDIRTHPNKKFFFHSFFIIFIGDSIENLGLIQEKLQQELDKDVIGQDQSDLMNQSTIIVPKFPFFFTNFWRFWLFFRWKN